MDYYSQIGQDKYINEKIFRGMENGFFVDIGAHDGITFSNSYFFENHKNWKGICVEPLPEVFELLKKNRQSICVEGAVSTEDGYQEFLRVQGLTRTEMLSGLVNKYNTQHKGRINQEIQKFGGNSKIIKVKTFTLQSILDRHNITEIDLCSIDTEGAEMAVIQSIDFNKVKIECIVTENNYGEKNVEEYLKLQGFRLVEKLDFDDIYLHCNSKFSIV